MSFTQAHVARPAGGRGVQDRPPTDTLSFLTEALSHELEGLENAEIGIHTCWGNPMMQRVFDKTSYANSLEIYLDRVKCDILTLEMKDRGLAELELLGSWKGKTKIKLAIGVVSHRTLKAETPDEVAGDIRKALQYMNVENLLVTSDCGFGRQGANHLVAFYKSAAAAQGANIVRREHGLPATYIPCADPQLSQDLVPPSFEKVGGLSGAGPKLHDRSFGRAPASGNAGRQSASAPHPFPPTNFRHKQVCHPAQCCNVIAGVVGFVLADGDAL
jgi:Cobalamin-independent synthase, Catalytic domain